MRKESKIETNRDKAENVYKEIERKSERGQNKRKTH